MLSKLSKFLFDHPFVYRSLRTLFLGGLPTRPLLKLLDSQAGDIILDVGCGSGFIAEKMKFERYIGIDHNPAMIEIARKREIPSTSFLLEEVSDYDFGALKPTKAILYGLLHHLDDASAIALLTRLSKIVTQWIVTLDSVYSKTHVINNFLCKFDRGKFVRTENEMLALIAKTPLKIETKLLHDANTKIAKYITFRLLP